MKNSVTKVREQLMVNGTKFIVEGLTDYRSKKEFDTTLPEKEVGEYGYFPVVFYVNQFGENNFSIHGSFRGMNVDKFGPTCVWLYTFDMLNNKTKGKIKYSDVTVLSVGEEK